MAGRRVQQVGAKTAIAGRRVRRGERERRFRRRSRDSTPPWCREWAARRVLTESCAVRRIELPHPERRARGPEQRKVVGYGEPENPSHDQRSGSMSQQAVAAVCNRAGELVITLRSAGRGIKQGSCGSRGPSAAWAAARRRGEPNMLQARPRRSDHSWRGRGGLEGDLIKLAFTRKVVRP